MGDQGQYDHLVPDGFRWKGDCSTQVRHVRRGAHHTLSFWSLGGKVKHLID